MNNIRAVLYNAIGWFFFAIFAIVFLKNESYVHLLTKSNVSTQVQQGGQYSGTSNLNQISGGQVIGMVPIALSGVFPLTIDGTLINSGTNISTVNLTNVANNKYTLFVTRDSSGNIVTVTATKN